MSPLMTCVLMLLGVALTLISLLAIGAHRSDQRMREQCAARSMAKAKLDTLHGGRA
jgi:hypothetical protein